MTASTVEHAATRRAQALRHGFSSGVLARGTSVACTFLSVPVVTGALGQSRYGAFAVIAGLAALLPFSDLGLGGGLVTALGAATGREDLTEQRRIVTAALLGLIAAAAVMLALFTAAGLVVDWSRPLGLSAEPFAGDVDRATAVFGTLFLVAVPGTLGTRLLQAVQRTHVANYWQLTVAPLTLLGYLLARSMGAGLPAFAAVAGGVPLVVGVACTTWVLATHPVLRPRRDAFDLTTCRHLLRLGSLFFVLTVAVAVAFETDALVLSWVLGPDAVAIYSVTFRLFALVTVVAALAFAPLWPAFAEALSRGDVPWARRTVWRSMKAGALWSLPAAALLVLLARPLVQWWVGAAFAPPLGLSVALGVWVVLVATQMPLVMLLNGAGVVRFQVVAATCMAVTNLALSVVLAHVVGVSGPVWGSVIAHTVCSGIPMLVYVRRRFDWTAGASVRPASA